MIVNNEYTKNTQNEYIERDNLATVKLAEQLATMTDEPISIVKNDSHLSIMVSEAPITFKKWGYNSQMEYGFALWARLQYINHEDKKAVIEELGLQAPNKIRTFNDKAAKKVTAWVEYQKAIYDALIKRSQEKVKKVDDFLANFQHTLDTMTGKGDYNYLRVGKDWDKKPDGTYSGTLTRGGLMYEFSINNNGYISQEIKTRYYNFGTSVDTFLKMSNNDLVGAN